MKRASPSIKPVFFKEIKVNSKFSYEKFIKNQYKILPKLTIRISENRPPEEKNPSKGKFLKVFKKAKFIRKFHMKGLYLQNENLYLQAFSDIAKKMSTVTSLSFHDYRRCRNQYRGLMVSWPKKMKYLKSLRFSIGLEDPERVRFDVDLPDKILLPTHSLKYARKLEELEITSPQKPYPSYMNDLWKFEGYPKSIKRLSILNKNNDEMILSSPLVCLKNLKSLRLFLYPNDPMRIMKPVYEFLSSPNCQIEALTLNFTLDFDIDISVCNAIKQLTELKKVKLQFSLIKYSHNLQILESLRDYPLKDLNLDIKVKDDEEIRLVTKFLSKKKKELEKLKLMITKEGRPFQSSLPLEGLLRTIDDFPNLSCLSLSFSCNQMLFMKNSVVSEKNIIFDRLFSKPVALRIFKIFLQKPFISEGGFFALLKTLKTSCPTLEKLQINIGGRLVCDEDKIKTLVEPITGLKNLRSLQLDNLSFESGQCFIEFIRAIYSLKYLTL